MQTSNTKEAFSTLGNYIESFINNFNTSSHTEAQKKFNEKLQLAKAKNSWFTIENQLFALSSWSQALKAENLDKWLSQYNMKENSNYKTIGIVAAGNIPLVGFHDILTVILSGNKAQVKYSSKDDVLIPYLFDLLFEIQPCLKEFYERVDRLHDFDAVIATGSDNTARYFESYFKNVPNLIRKNRTSVAILDGSETQQELEGLAKDMLQYFGLGCRNVTKIYVPKDYDLDLVFNALFPWQEIINHHKYANNYDYYRTIYLMKVLPILENGFVLLKEDQGLFSPISCILYEFYEDKAEVKKQLSLNASKIQCVVGKGSDEIPFGDAQTPELWDYADNIDSMKWLLNLK